MCLGVKQNILAVVLSENINSSRAVNIIIHFNSFSIYLCTHLQTVIRRYFYYFHVILQSFCHWKICCLRGDDQTNFSKIPKIFWLTVSSRCVACVIKKMLILCVSSTVTFVNHCHPFLLVVKMNDAQIINFSLYLQGNKVWICPACGRQDDGSPMIGCDLCDDWYHFACMGIEHEPAEEEKWFCPRCTKKKGEKGKKKRKWNQGVDSTSVQICKYTTDGELRWSPGVLINFNFYVDLIYSGLQ